MRVRTREKQPRKNLGPHFGSLAMALVVLMQWTVVVLPGGVNPQDTSSASKGRKESLFSRRMACSHR